MKPKVDPNILPMSIIYCNRSFKSITPPHFSTRNRDTCHDIIGYGLVEIESQVGRNYET